MINNYKPVNNNLFYFFKNLKSFKIFKKKLTTIEFNKTNLTIIFNFFFYLPSLIYSLLNLYSFIKLMRNNSINYNLNNLFVKTKLNFFLKSYEKKINKTRVTIVFKKKVYKNYFRTFINTIFIIPRNNKLHLFYCFCLFNNFYVYSIKLNVFFNIKINENNYFFFYNVKKFKFSKILFTKKLININDKFNLNLEKNNLNFFSNKYLIDYLNFYDNENSFRFKPLNKTHKLYNNYYPIIDSDHLSFYYFLKKFKNNKNIDYILYTNKIVIKFLENILKKKIYIKIINNNFFRINNNYLNYIIRDYKRFKPLYFKSFSVIDFIEILWYSFTLKDLKMLSNWISIFMESLNFKNHKKFISFFNNFINKNSSTFMDVLGIKGFFFDIRGKVGVTGSSKKRHLCFKFGSLKKSSKYCKIDFNQNLVRTYSGVMGLTYIISY